MTEDKKPYPCPSLKGSMTGYKIEYLNEDGNWKPLSIDESPEGVPYPMFDGRYLSVMDLMGYEQAMTIIWSSRASWQANPLNKHLRFHEFRLVPYQVEYSVEALRNEDESIEIDTHRSGLARKE